LAHSLHKLFALLDECMLADRFRLRRQLKDLDRRQRDSNPADLQLARLQQDLDKSIALAQIRRERAPEVSFPVELPISQRLDDIRELIRNNQVVVLCGETGSGKSTQLPKICLELGRGIFGKIAHTQPRRIAARSLASRISSELKRETGDAVGYKIRFHDRVTETTHIKLLTDGMLLAEVQQDKFLNEYDTIILDEAHERSLNIDFLLGYLRNLLPKRPDLKLIITSATIDPERFSQHFDGAPIIEVSGRTYPVEVRYQPPEDEAVNERDESMQQAILDAVDELSRVDRGDILVFLSGEREIRETAESLHKHRMQITEILPLFARLGAAEQSKIFKPSGQRRIVLATNVAETSLTVPGIRHVIDAGYARISRYSHRSKIQRLPVERISQASADQRKGRCGRVAEGVCIRLYSEENFEARREFIEPEIQRTNLASVILQMKQLGFGDIREFPFLDEPDDRLIKDGYRVLEEIGAVDGLGRISRLGRKLARLPLDPRIGRMLLESAQMGCLREVLVIAAALSVQDPRDRPMDKQQLADEAHALFKDEASDFMGYLSLWDFLEEKQRHLTRRKFGRLCREYFLSATRVQEWHDIHRQIRAQMHDMGYKDNKEESSYESIHMAVLSGLLSHVGFRSGASDKGYQGARNTQFYAFPGSGVFASQPKWIMAAELVETSRLYARTLARIQPEWVERLAGHLVKRSYSEPHWQGKRGQVGAYEKVTLYGLPLVPRRRINFGPIDPVQSREIFIRFALVEGDFHTRAPFWRHNQELRDYIHDLEAKSRRRDVLVSDDIIYQYYEQRLPEGIYSKSQFEGWLKKISGGQPKLLHMRLQDLMQHDATDITEDQYPDVLNIHGMELPLKYDFTPGEQADGITLMVPAAVLNQLTTGRLDWLVPGMLAEKLTLLIKGLPKSLRKNFVPVPEYVKRSLALMEAGDTPLIQALAAALKQLTGVHVGEDEWNPESLADHLRMQIQVTGESGRVLERSRDLLQLQKNWAGTASIASVSSSCNGVEQSGLTRWDFPSLPEQVEAKSSGIRLKGYPALVDEGDSVAVKVLDSSANAARAQHDGLRRLFMLSMPKDIRYLRKHLPNLQQMRLQYARAEASPGAGKLDLEDELVALIMDRTFVLEQPDVRDAKVFDERIGRCKPGLLTNSNEICKLVSEILGLYQQVRKQLSGATQINWLASTEDMKQQLHQLVYRGFLQQTPWQHLLQYPRYLKAMSMRLDKLAHAAVRDQQQMTEIRELQTNWQQRHESVQKKGQVDERLEEIGWMLQELRISIFAQELKTLYPVSGKRIQKRWRELGL
jgi:ATP-dependent helicase HrpA